MPRLGPFSLANALAVAAAVFCGVVAGEKDGDFPAEGTVSSITIRNLDSFMLGKASHYDMENVMVYNGAM